jgi:hypothetical protein
MNTNEKNCGNCSSWKQIEAFDGQCRFRPPRVSLSKIKKIITFWPEVDAWETACTRYTPDKNVITKDSHHFDELWKKKFNPPPSGEKETK